ncbi:hypothetical protein BJ741DRAFT_161974 [Chytriomyces cf. hyalinus JEL632]|nr:hypothetical protein BJ741DRAFT_161974 [Chytriomyces cf. hyalinus JEL632]
MRTDFSNEDIAAMALGGVTAALAFLETGSALYMIHSATAAKELRFSLVNTTLLLGCFSTVGLLTAFIVGILLHENSLESNVLTVAEVCFFALMEATYLIFIWNRTQALVKIKSPTLFRRLSTAVNVIPALCFLAIIPVVISVANKSDEDIVRISYYAFMLSCAASGLSVLVFDISLLVIFQWFLNSNYSPDESPSEDFIIVARYGRISTILCIAAAGSYAAGILLGPIHAAFNLVIALCYAFINTVWIALLHMKWKLQRFTREKERAQACQKNIAHLAMGSLDDLIAMKTGSNIHGAQSSAY